MTTRQTPLHRALGSAALLLLLAAGCATDDINSGLYRCDDDQDCTWGWKCMSAPGAEKRCFNPNASDTGVATPDVTTADGGPTPDSIAPKPDTVVAHDQGDDADQGGPTACTPNVSECVDLASKRACNAQGTGYLAAEACPDQQRCEKGVCLAAQRVVANISATVQIAYDTFTRTTRTIGGLGATFSYNAGPAGPTTSPQALNTCRLEPLGTSSGGSAVDFDAGPISASGIPSGTRTLSFVTGKGYAATPALPATLYPWGQLLTFSGSGANLVHGAFSVKVQAPTRREIIGPAHMSQHTRTQPLTVSWNGATNKGDLLLDILDDANTGSGSYVRCRVEDTGSFTVPASYIANFDTTGPSTIVLIEHHSTSFTAKGIAEGSATATLLTQSQLLLRP